MSNSAHQLPEFTNELTRQTRYAFWIALSASLLALGLLVIDFYTLYTSPAGSNYMFLGIDGCLLLGTATATWLSWRGQVKWGMGLLLGLASLVCVVLTLTLTNLAILMAVTIILLSTAIANLTLSGALTRWVVITGFVLAALIVLLDSFWPFTRSTPGNQPFADWLVIVFLLVYGVMVIRQFKSYRLRTKLIIGFVGTGILIAGIIIFAADYFTRQELTKVASQTLLAAAKQTANNVDNFIRSNLDNVSIEAKLPVIVSYLNLPPDQRAGSPEEAEASAVLNVLSRKENPYLSSYALLDRQGQDILDTYANDVGLDKADRDYFQMVLKTGQPYASPVRFSKTVKDASIYFAAPVRNNFGEIIGVIRVRYDATALQQIIRPQNDQAGQRSYAILLDENQIYLAHGTATNFKLKTVAPLDPARLSELQASGRLPDRAPAELTTNFPDFAQALTNAAAHPYFTGYIGGTNSPVEREQVAIFTLQMQPWQVAFAQPQEVFLAPVADQTRYTTILAAGIVIVVMGLALGLGQYLTRPIINLTEVAQRVNRGDLAVQANIESHDEVGQLAEAFNSMTKQLRASIGSLEDQVRERTAELALSMEVGQRAAAIRNLDELLPIITEYIRAQFNLYYTQVYFVDDTGQNLILRAGTGSVGVQLLALHHYLPLGLGSIVGRVAAEGKSVVVIDTQNSDIHKPNPLLPGTRAELAVPLLVEGRVIGVLDMQADKVNTFTENNLTVFEAMGTQLAVSIDSAQQWARAREAQQKVEEAVKQLTHQSWVERLASYRGDLSFAYDLAEVAPVSVFDSETANGDNKLVVPLVVQNEPIGELAVKAPSQHAPSSDAQALVVAVAQQLAQKVENLRLFDQTQQRAAREQMARQITDKIRASRDIESALRTAAEELSKALGAARTVVDLKVNDDTD